MLFSSLFARSLGNGFTTLTDAFFLKINGALYPASDHDRELLDKIKSGEPCRLTFKRVRNYEFLKKYMALLNLAFDYWEPSQSHVADLDYTCEITEKCFERFRKDIAILSGYYEQSVRLNGEIRTEAKSIAFGNMTEDEFEKLYSASIAVIIKYVLKNYTGEQLRSVVEQVEEFG